MARIDIKDLSHAYMPNPTGTADFALRDVDISLRDGGAYALLGPSGCGKSTLLRIISGLYHPTRGRVHFDGRDVTALTATQRHVAEVFQFPVVYETMNVFENLAFPLRNRAIPTAEIKKRVAEVAEMLGLGDKLDSKSGSLGASERQLVSLGRGLVRTDVDAILFDEPLTVIDPQEKWHLRTRLKQLHQQFQRTMIYVTHDQTEALTIADTIMVMREGQILQSGTPAELFERPAHKFVGQFIGSPGMNFLACKLDGKALLVNGHSIASQRNFKNAAGQELLELGIRPEHIRLSRDQSGLAVRLQRVESTGRRKIASFDAGGTTIRVALAADEEIPTDSHRLHIDPDHTLLYAAEKLLLPSP